MHDGVALVDMTSSEPAVTHIMPEGNSVGGVTSLGNDVFVVRYPTSQQIEVYDAVTFTLQRWLAVPQLGSLSRGLAVCPSNKCIYASDWDNNSVHRVELSGSNAVMKWSVASMPAGLSVNRAQNLLVVSRGERKLQEFTTHGTLLQNIELPSHIGSPWHAIDCEGSSYSKLPWTERPSGDEHDFSFWFSSGQTWKHFCRGCGEPQTVGDRWFTEECS